MKATDAQMGFMFKLMDQIKRRDDSDRRFYDIVKEVSGHRSTLDLSIGQARRIINMLLSEVE